MFVRQSNFGKETIQRILKQLDATLTKPKTQMQVARACEWNWSNVLSFLKSKSLATGTAATEGGGREATG